MTNFTTRIILFGQPTWMHYAKLQSEMSARGFTDRIVGTDGVAYELPHGEYTSAAADTLAQVHAKAKAAANAVWIDNGVLVTQSAGVTFSGLRRG